MKRSLKFSLAFFSTILIVTSGFAGNKDRAGQAGASGLLINPWARSTGWAGANTASATGLEALNMNVAGTAFTKKTEILFAHTQWLGAGGEDGVSLNSFGFTQRTGETGVIGFSVMSMNFGRVAVTTVDKPEGGLGTFSPNFMNLTLSYAKEFSNSIYGGLAMKVISERMSNVGASGIALDAGVRYVTGENDRIKFGIALRNVGPPMHFRGDGLSIRALIPSTGANLTMEQRTTKFELPSMVNIGASYDFILSPEHKITAAGNFTSNSFTKDQILTGVEYGFKSIIMLRAGYMHESGIRSFDQRTTAFTGPTAGLTLELPLNDKGSSFAFDYSYRAANPFNGVHTIGARINL
jgi:hypothetical protein